MCVTYCHRRRVLYWNHTDCHPAECELAAGPPHRCEDCRHRAGESCALTRAPLPGTGGCCHWNVTPVQGLQEVTREMLAPLGMTIEETEVYVLMSLDVPYQLGPQGETLVDPDTLGLPFTYSRGTEHMPDEAVDWSDWFGRWCLQED